MCMYWKKMHTCGHEGDRPYIEMCRPGYLSNTVCADIGMDEKPRKSHFPCYPCIKSEVRTESEARVNAERDAFCKAREASENAQREKQTAVQRAKEERIRREAHEKAAREREEEARLKAMKQKEEERAKKEGGLWIETGSGKKQKGKKGAAMNFPAMPFSAPLVLRTFADREKKENDGNVKMSPKKQNDGSAKMSPRKQNDGGAQMSPLKDGKSTDTGGRAGVWGPKKILTRKENMGMKK
jgi:hypothetical protein